MKQRHKLWRCLVSDQSNSRISKGKKLIYLRVGLSRQFLTIAGTFLLIFAIIAKRCSSDN